MFLGDELDTIVNSIITGEEFHKCARKEMLISPTVPAIRRDNTDRNRTSPFAFTGNKFEFRMVGSSQNIALANTVLNTAVAKSFSDFADVLEKADNFDEAVDELIRSTLREHSRILFAGNSYTKEWEEEACRRGLSNFKSAPEAYAHLDDEKNVELFEKFGVMSRTELRSRREIYFSNYRKIKNIEARTMLEMAMRDYIPAVNAYIGDLSKSLKNTIAVLPDVDLSSEKKHLSELTRLLSEVYGAYSNLESLQKRAISIENTEDAAFYYKNKVNAAMEELRSYVDELEVITARDYWPVPTYGDMTYGGIL
jgi:glutamine synthetase